MTIGLDPIDETERLHVLHDAAPAFETIEPGVLSRQRRHPTIEADHAARRQVVAASDLEVGRIVTWRDLDDTGTELGIDGAIGDDLKRDGAFHRRHLEGLPHVALVALVLGMDSHRRVAELRLRPYGA